MAQREDRAWQSSQLTNKYLTGVRAAIPQAETQLDVMLRVISADNRQVLNFLDLGCGGGALATALLDRYPKARGVLVDFSRPMLDAARGQLKSHAASLHFVQADFADPAWVESIKKHAPFGTAVSGYAIHHQPDARKQALYTEIHNLLNPGGIFINIEHVAPATAWVESLFETHFIENLYELEQTQGGARTREELAAEYYHREDKQANILTPVEVQCDWLRRIGFQDVDCYFKIFELAVFGGRKR